MIVCFHSSLVFPTFSYVSTIFDQQSLFVSHSSPYIFLNFIQILSPEFLPIIFHHIFPHTPQIFPYLSGFCSRSSPPVSTQAAEISALCACVDAYVALGDVGAPQRVGKPWENSGKKHGKWGCFSENQRVDV